MSRLPLQAKEYIHHTRKNACHHRSADDLDVLLDTVEDRASFLTKNHYLRGQDSGSSDLQLTPCSPYEEGPLLLRVPYTPYKYLDLTMRKGTLERSLSISLFGDLWRPLSRYPFLQLYGGPSFGLPL
ncbi:hypothetical protein AXF42_Ash012169 [Apostasia shenzhenica]|uniref:Uncharacterized protein n=1 Tax=Apostasia shenzhenica TaxID=1088818 RepID=A0A2I0B464_9ASPA|nr:hypothetical protein AXF42_Ash012169 [Apostasia shenzhenica]